MSLPLRFLRQISHVGSSKPLLMRLVIGCLFFILAGFHATNAAAASQQYMRVSCASLGGAGANWTNPELAESSNDSYATALVDGTTTDPLQCLSYGFAIPANAIVVGIEVNIERRSSSIANGGSRDASVRLVKAGAAAGTDLATATTYTTTDTVETHGGPTNLWGTTWTPAQINAANFGAQFSATKASAAGGGHTVSVDQIQIVVYYDTLSQRQSQVNCATLGGGGANWTNPERGESSNDLFATALVDGSTTDPLQCLNYGFAIPSTATILGIEVNVERKSSSTANGGSRDASVQLVKAGTAAGTDNATATTYTTADLVETHGGPTDLWGTTWTPAEINAANFGAQFSATKFSAAGAAHTVSIDQIQIVVYYNTPPPSPALSTPANSAVLTSGSLTFDWTDVLDDDFDSVSYELQVDNNGCTFPSPEVSQSLLATSTYTTGAALGDGSYCWRARAVDSAGLPGAWSTTFGFTINSVGAFDTVEVGSGIATAIKTKIAGAAFSLDVLAAKGGAVHTGYLGPVTVEIVNPATGGGVCAAMSALQNLGTVTFVAADAGRKTVSAFNYTNATPDARVRITDTSVGITSCSTDNFAIRPFAFANFSVQDNDWLTALPLTRTLNNTNLATTALVHRAGRPFSVNASAINGAGVPAVTTAYTATPTPVLVVCAGTGCTATVGTFNIGTGTAAAGVISSSTATYSDVGSFGLQLQDTSFAAVDAADSTTSERYITSAVIDVGRFVPDSFILTAPSFTNRTDIAGCHIQTTGSITAGSTALTVSSATGFSIGNQVVIRDAGAASDLIASITAIAGNVLSLNAAASTTVSGSATYKLAPTYQNEPFGLGYSMSAINASSGITVLYGGAWAKGVVTAQAENSDAGTNLNASGTRLTGVLGTWNNGTYSVATNAAQFVRNTNPDGPFDSLQIGIGVTDADGPALQGRNMNASTTGACGAGCTAVAIGTTKIRFGRLKMTNAHGSELLNLRVPSDVQYWAGTYFTGDAEDSCTSIAASSISLVKTPPACTTSVSGNVGHIAGHGNATLLKPLAKCWADVTVDLVAENKTYLQGKWSGAGYTQNPTARATFGIRSSGPVIYMREVY
jgi:hypothetical protein